MTKRSQVVFLAMGALLAAVGYGVWSVVQSDVRAGAHKQPTDGGAGLGGEGGLVPEPQGGVELGQQRPDSAGALREPVLQDKVLVATSAGIQEAIDGLPPEGGEIVLSPGHYWLDEPINLRGRQNVVLRGAGSPVIDRVSGTVLHARFAQAGQPVIDMVGSIVCRLEDFEIRRRTNAGHDPACGILLGRDSRASAGLHTFSRIRVAGRFTKAGVINIGSESNTWDACRFMNLTGRPSYWSSTWNTIGASSPFGGIEGGSSVGLGGAVSNVTQRFRDCTFGIPQSAADPERFKDAVAIVIEPRQIGVLFDGCYFTGRQPCRAAILLTGTPATNLPNNTRYLTVRDAYTELFGARAFLECAGPAEFGPIDITGRFERLPGSVILLTDGATVKGPEHYP